MSFFKKIGKGLKKVAPLAAIAAPFIPGVGGAISGALSKVGSLFGDSGGSSAQSQAQAMQGPPDPANPTEFQSVNVQDKKEPASAGFDWSGLFKAVAPSAIGGIASYVGQQQTNVANAHQAQRQMEFQAEQTGTSYQRGVADMKAAGLNPMLAYSQGGAASGGGAQATMGNELGAGANSALSVAQAMQQMEATRATIGQTDASTDNLVQQNRNLQAQRLKTLAEIKTEEGKPNNLAQQTISYELANNLARESMASNISSAQSTAALRGYEATGSKYDLSKRSAESGFWSSAVGRSYPYVSRATEQANSAANVFRKFIPFTNDQETSCLLVMVTTTIKMRLRPLLVSSLPFLLLLNNNIKTRLTLILLPVISGLLGNFPLLFIFRPSGISPKSRTFSPLYIKFNVLRLLFLLCLRT